MTISFQQRTEPLNYLVSRKPCESPTGMLTNKMSDLSELKFRLAEILFSNYTSTAI